MKLKDIFNWLKKAGKPEKDAIPIIEDDPYAMIKHKTQRRYSTGSRIMPKHNNRKMTRGRRVQYVTGTSGTKPIYHTGF
jgi:hypothetical protein